LTDNVQPKVLDLWQDDAVDLEVLRTKRKFTIGGPPMPPEDPILEQFHYWQTAITQFLEFPLDIKMECFNSAEEYRGIYERYELIYETLTRATAKNKSVRLQTNSISKFSVHYLCTWWATVVEMFQPSNAQISVLRNDFLACVQKNGRTGIEFLIEIDKKVDVLRNLGKFMMIPKLERKYMMASIQSYNHLSTLI